MFQSIKSSSGKLLFKWDGDKRVIQIQRKKEVTYIQFRRDGSIAISAFPPIGLDEFKV